MFRALPLSLVAVLAGCVAPSVENTATTAERIIGGQASTSADFPSAGALLLIVDFGGGQTFGMPVCTGTLVAPDTVITAGHCVTDLFGGGFPTEYFFSFEEDVSSFGMSTVDLPPRTTRVVKLVAHPSFDINTEPQPGLGQWNDVGIVFLEAPVTDVTPEYVADALDGPAIVVNAQVDIAGYGQTLPNAEFAGVKNHASTIVNEVGNFEMQIGSLPPVPQKCHGDSGGPTYLEIIDGRFPSRRLIGITSRAYDERDCNAGGIDSRADAYRSWFEGEMILACNDGTRQPNECAAGGGLPIPSGTPIDAGVRDSGLGPPDSGQQDSGQADSGQADSGQGGADVLIGDDASFPDDSGVGSPDSAVDAGVLVFGGRRDDRDDCSCSATSSRDPSSFAFYAFLAIISFGVARSRARRGD